MTDKRLMKRMFGLKMQEVKGSCKFYNSCYFSYMDEMIESRRTKQTIHVAGVSVMGNSQKILVGNSEDKSSFGTLTCRWDDNIKM